MFQTLIYLIRPPMKTFSLVKMCFILKYPAMISFQTGCIKLSYSSTQTPGIGQPSSMRELQAYFTLYQFRNIISVKIDSVLIDANRFRKSWFDFNVLLTNVSVQYELSRKIVSQLRLLPKQKYPAIIGLIQIRIRIIKKIDKITAGTTTLLLV